uniref:Uncharacterized protein n=1 Tax=Glossina pallidipes TaxID=7398 RepID=A0A1A9ZW08_GLOPL
MINYPFKDENQFLIGTLTTKKISQLIDKTANNDNKAQNEITYDGDTSKQSHLDDSPDGTNEKNSNTKGLTDHIGILQIYKGKFQVKPVPLKSARASVFESLNVANLADELHLDEGDVSNKVKDMAQKRATAMIEKAKEIDHVK